MSKSKIFFLALATAANLAGAATQGTLGASSTGTFTNTFIGAPRQVQVLGLKDATMTINSGNVRSAFFSDGPGVADKFCVVDTSGGAVKLTVTGSNPHGTDDQFLAKSSAGESLFYYQSFYTDSGTPVGRALDTTGFTVPAAVVKTSAAQCGDGNVTKSIVPAAFTAWPATGRSYIDTVTVVATPI